jgi:NADPH:quinone reductase-like Zn-dependent oxidoreductase
LGAQAIDYKACPDWELQVKSVDVILDCVGQSHFNKGLSLISMDGNIVLYGLLSGDKVQDFSLREILSKRVAIQGTTLRSRSDNFKAELVKRFT